jgi:FkbM family methyltransferase
MENQNQENLTSATRAAPPASSPAKPPYAHPVPSKPNVLARLRKFLPISAIVDVGVRECTGELIQAFPEKHHYLFEPMGLFQPVIEKNYAAVPHTLIPLALSDADAMLYLIQSSLERDKRITHSQISPTPKECDGHTIISCEPFVVRRFDSLELASNIANNFLLKVDVDGKDLEVIQGFGPHLQKASAVIIECTTKSLIKRLGYLESQGFWLIDLVDIVHYGPALYQLDAVLVRKDLITKELKPNISEFQRELWRPAKV